MQRKKSEQSPTAVEDQEVLTPEISQSTPVKKHVRKIEEYDEIVHPRQDDRRLPRAIDMAARDMTGEDEDDVDPIDALLHNIDQQHGQGFILRVDRLPDYEKTGKWGRGAPTAFCGEITPSLGWESDIQGLYGPGHYRVTLLDERYSIVKKWKAHIAAPPPAAQLSFARSAPASAPVFNQTGQSQQPAKDPFDTFLDQAEKLARLRKAMGWDNEPPPVAPAPAPTPDKPLEEKIIESLLGMGEKSQPLIERVLEKYFGQPEKETGVIEMLGEIAKPLIPVIMQAFAQSSAASQSQAVHPPAAMLGASPPPQPRPEASTPPLEYDQYGDEPYMEVIYKLIEECSRQVRDGALDQVAIERGAGWVRQFQVDNPIWSDLITAMLSGPPESVLASLCLIAPEAAPLAALPLARSFITALQAKLRGESNG